MDWFLYYRELRHDRVKGLVLAVYTSSNLVLNHANFFIINYEHVYY